MSTITPSTDDPLRRPTVQRLRAALHPELARALDDALQAGAPHDPDFEVWAVGGVVRDVALSRTLVDLDLATTGDPHLLAVAAASALAGTVEAHPEFGTASAAGAAGRLDFARLRTEAYARPGALPTPAFDATIEEDLVRRDFSVNALALCLAGPRRGEIADPCDGLAELAARRLRVLHANSFRDDATRIWRGARFAARLGLRPDSETRALLEAARDARWLDTISGERLWAEFERTAGEPPGRVLALLEEWGALEASAPGLRLRPESARALSRRRGPMDPALLYAVLVAPLNPAERAAIADRLAVPREAVRAARDAAALLEVTTPAPDTLAAVEGVSEISRRAALWLDPARQPDLQRALRRWEHTRPLLAAADLEALGVPRGPALGEWLRRLRAARYLGTLRTPAGARREVRASLASASAEAVKEQP